MKFLRHFLLFLLVFGSIVFDILAQQTKPRVFILTDIGGDPDDQQSLVRFLVYTNELEVEGLCATSRLEHGEDTKPELIREQVEAYGKVLPNLKLHAEGFPSAGYLLERIKNGQGNQHQIGEGFDTEASDWIIQVADKPDSRPVYISIWGGSRELAQALWKVKQNRTKEETDKFVAKLRVYLIGDQDGHKAYLLQNFPSLLALTAGYASFKTQKVIETAVYRGQYLTGNTNLQNNNWTRENIVTGHGPLGALYPISAHGSNGMKEGDTPSFNGLISNGLNFPEHPDWGGWGGRFRKLRQNLYIDAPDFAFGDWNERHTVSRWRPYFQRDFQARMDWCVKSFAEANHAPVAILNKNNSREIIQLKAKPGNIISLDASSSTDPEKQQLSFNWWVYSEPSKYIGTVAINGAQSAKPQISIPADAQGKTLHLILEVSDSGTPTLTSFRRILIGVE